MFKSKIRSVIIPQYEHGRLAGTFVSLWGNKDFKRPLFDFTSFVQGVTLHDWHYGIIDNLAIGESAEDDWLKIVRKGVDYWFDDPITDIVVKLHISRLLSDRNTAVTDAMIDQIEQRIAERLPQTNFLREQFEWADRITACCDQLAFDFSFEAPIKAGISVFADEKSSKETKIRYEIKPKGEISITPWPFSIEAFSGIIVGYHQKDYPVMLKPEVIHFRCEKSE